MKSELERVLIQERNLKTGFLYKLNHVEGRQYDIEIFISGDGHGMWKGVKVTRIAIKVKLEKGIHINAPSHCHTCMLYQGTTATICAKP